MEITPELLADLKAKAQEATPGPWEKDCLRNIFRKPQNRDEDWQPIVLAKEKHGKYFPGPENTAFIAAASPDIVLALIAELEDLRSKEDAQKWACGECQEVEQELKQKVERLQEENIRLKVELHDLDSSGGEMAKDCRRLEKEADWLAEQLLACTDDNRIDTCRYTECGICSDIDTVAGWRDAANKAVEGEDGH